MGNDCEVVKMIKGRSEESEVVVRAIEASLRTSTPECGGSSLCVLLSAAS